MAAPELRQEDRPLIVLIDPKWNFQQDHFEMDRFFEEARITEESITVLRGRFYKFCSQQQQQKQHQLVDAGGPAAASGIDGSSFLTLGDFCRLNKHYAICRPEEEEQYFRAMDRSGQEQLLFDDFLLGCSAANPATPHILNSFTGFVRARYIFDFYNVSKSGSLEFEELARLLADARRHLDEGLEAQRRHAREVAQELGEVSVVTLRVGAGFGCRGSSSAGGVGPSPSSASTSDFELCDVRASRKWTGLKVRREIARELQVPVEGQRLQIGTEALGQQDLLEKFVAPGQGSTRVSAILDWERWPREPEPSIADGIGGIERLVHVSFDAFYKALTAEQLRGTSRLFRFHRQILHSRSRGGPSAAAVGGA